MIIRTSYAGWSFIGRVPHVGSRCLVLVRLYYLEGLTNGTCYFPVACWRQRLGERKTKPKTNVTRHAKQSMKEYQTLTKLDKHKLSDSVNTEPDFIPTR